jgi:hypothetical protein
MHFLCTTFVIYSQISVQGHFVGMNRQEGVGTRTLPKSRHFQPTPVQTIDKTINTVNGVGNEERGIVYSCEEREHDTRDIFRFSPSLISIGYYWLY